MYKQSPLITHVVYRFAVGGLENGVVNLINHLPQHKWRHAVIALDDVSSDFVRRVSRTDVEYVAFHKKPGHLAKEYGRLASVMKAIRPDILHTRNLAALEATVPAWATNIPIRVHGEHGWDSAAPDGNNVRYRLARAIYRPFVHHYVVVSRQLERYIIVNMGIEAGRVTRICNGVDTERFVPKEREQPRDVELPFPEDCWLIGTVGRLQAVKDQPTLARAFAYAVKTNREAAKRMRLVIAGDGLLRDEVQRILHQAGIAHLAWLPGERADVPAILRCLDCFVLPSRSEGISNTLLESMASGLPSIATNVGGNPELVVDGVTGTLVPPADAEALGQSIISYFSDPVRAQKHGAAARRRAQQYFDISSMVSKYDRLYTALLHAGPGTA